MRTLYDYNLLETDLYLQFTQIEDIDLLYLRGSLELNNILRILGLGYQTFGSMGFRSLLKTLRNINTFEIFYLGEIIIRNDMAKCLAKLLKYSFSLSEIHLRNCYLSSYGVKYLSHALESNNVLTTSFNCNDTRVLS